MTTRVYLTAVTFVDEAAVPTDLPVERVFINAGDVSEVWVEAESTSVPDPGKRATFALRRPLDIGFNRIMGTVERKVRK